MTGVQTCALPIYPLLLFFKRIIKPFDFNNLQQFGYYLTLKIVYDIQSFVELNYKKTILPKYKQLRYDISFLAIFFYFSFLPYYQ